MSAYRRVWTVFISPLLAVLLTSPVHAIEWLPVTPQELQLTSEPKAPGAAAIYLYRQVDRDDTASETEIYERIKILKEEGRKYADVEIRYTKGDESVRAIEARTIRPDGTIVKFDGTIYDTPVRSGHEVKLMAKTFTMPQAGVGSIIEYRYRFSQNPMFVFNSHWILSQELFTQHAKFALAPYTGLSLRWSWPMGLPEGTADPARDRSGKIRLEAHDVPAFAIEELMPPENELKYRVDFIYFEEGRFTKDPAEYWKRVGKDVTHDVERFVDRRKAMEHAVAEIVQPDDSPETKLRKIYTRIQRIHNETYEPAKTEQELKRQDQSRNVEDVWTRGSGNATQLNYLLIALARAAGIRANSVLVATRDEYFFNPKLMNERQLNSNLVIASADGKDYFLDPGVPFTAFGMLPWNETAVQALQLDSDGAKWITTPLPKAADARIERKAQLKLEDGGTLSGKLTVRYCGLEAAWRRRQESTEDNTERQQYLENQLRGIVPSGIDIKLTNTPDWSAWEEPLVAEFDLQVPGWVASAGQRELLRAGLFGAVEDRTFTHQTRTQPIYFEFPFQYSDDISIEIPSGKHVNSLPKPRNLEFKTYSYGMTAEEKDGTLHLKRDISVSLLIVNVKYYGVLQDFFRNVRTADEEQIVISAAVAQR
jgi:hypothetical protein